MHRIRKESQTPLHGGHAQRGMTAIEMVIVLGFILQILIMGTHYMRQASDSVAYQSFSKQIQMVHQAAKHYVQDNYSVVQSATNQGGSYTLTVPELMAQGYLFPTFNVEKNVFQQQLRIYVNSVSISNQRNVLQIVTYTVSGQTLPELGLREAAAHLGAEGGYVSQLSPEEITGTFKGWSLPIESLVGLSADDDEAGDNALTKGHLVMAAYVDERDALDASTFLRRIKISGFEQGNIMETSLGLVDQESLELGLSKGEVVDSSQPNRTRLKHGELQFGVDQAKVTIPQGGVLYLGENCMIDNQGNLTVGGTITTGNPQGDKVTITSSGAIRVTSTSSEVEILSSALSVKNKSSQKGTVLKSSQLLFDSPTNTPASGQDYAVLLSADKGELSFGNGQTRYGADHLLLRPVSQDASCELSFSGGNNLYFQLLNNKNTSCSLRLNNNVGKLDLYAHSYSVPVGGSSMNLSADSYISMLVGDAPDQAGTENTYDLASIEMRETLLGTTYASQLCSRNLRSLDSTASHYSTAKKTHDMTK